jgi:hypothetical protein
MSTPLERELTMALGDAAEQIHSMPPGLPPIASADRPTITTPASRRSVRSLSRRWLPLLAAAVVVLLSLGVALVVQASHGRSPSPATSNTVVPVPASSSALVTIPSLSDSAAPSISTSTVAPAVAAVPKQFAAQFGNDISVYDSASGAKVRTVITLASSSAMGFTVGSDGALYGTGADPSVGNGDSGLWRVPMDGSAATLLVKEAAGDAGAWTAPTEHDGTIAFAVSRRAPDEHIVLVSTAGVIVRRIPYEFDVRDALTPGQPLPTDTSALIDAGISAVTFLGDGTLAVSINVGQYCPQMYLIDPSTATSATQNRQAVSSAAGDCDYSIAKISTGILIGQQERIVLVDPQSFDLISTVYVPADGAEQSENLFAAGDIILGDQTPVGSSTFARSGSRPFVLNGKVLTEIPLGPDLSVRGSGSDPRLAAHVLGWMPGT